LRVNADSYVLLSRVSYPQSVHMHAPASSKPPHGPLQKRTIMQIQRLT
jgi:hypothetical protein